MAAEALLSRLAGVRQTGSGWVALCPAHEDRQPSLSVGQGDDGRALVHCHAGCTPEAVVTALGLTLADLMPPRADQRPRQPASAPAAATSTAAPATATSTAAPAANGRAKIVARYGYTDEKGRVLYEVVRYEPKSFRQRQPRPGGGWIWSVRGVRVVPYRLHVLARCAGAPVVVVEGEKDVQSLAEIGVLATCNAGGAGKWTAEHAQYLAGRPVAILPDNDEPGRAHAEAVARSLAGVAASVRVVALPGLPDKGDVSDWIAAGGTREALLALIQAAPVWQPTEEPWPELQPFAAAAAPEFPAAALPPVLREWVEAESIATQTPPDLAALLALAVVAATIARRVVVEPRPGWREPTNLYVAVLLDPGNRKSAVFADATAPLRELEAELIEGARSSVARALSQRRQDERRLAKLERAAAEKGDLGAAREAGDLAADLAAQAEPALPRLLVDDATAERLGMLLAEQGGRIASMSAEGTVFDLMAGLYSERSASNLGVYLMGHSGDELIVDRVSRRSVRVERPALTCAYAMQPAVIEGLAEHTAFRGRGLLARFLYAAPDSWIGRRMVAAPPVPAATREAYRSMVRALADTPDGTVLRLTPSAEARLREWEAEIEAMLADGSEMETIRDWGAKLAGATLRLAAVLHAAEHGPAGSIGVETVEGAIVIARYLIPHAEVVLTAMAATEGAAAAAESDALYLLRWIERHGRREFTRSEAQQHGRRRFPRAEAIDPALAELVRRGYIRQRPAEPSGPGRPPSPAYDVNPAAFADASGEKRAEYSKNSGDPPEKRNCQNSICKSRTLAACGDLILA